MDKSRILFEDIMCNTAAFAAIVCPFMFMVYLRSGTAAAWMCLLTLPVFLALYAFRMKVKTFWVFISLHLAVLALPFLALGRDILIFVIMFAFALSCCFYSIRAKYKGEPESAGTFLLVGSMFCIIIAVIASYKNFDGLIGIVLTLELLMVICCLALRTMKRLDDSLLVLSSRRNADNRRIISFNNLLLAGYIAATLLISSLSFLFMESGANVIKAVLKLIGGLISWLIAALLKWLLSLAKPQGYAEPPQATGPDFVDMMEEFRTETGMPSDFAVIMERILSVLAIAAVIVLFCYSVYKVIKKLYKSFLRQDDGDIEEDIERNTSLRRAFRRTGERTFGNGYERKIRMRYYKAVSRQKNIEPKKTDTTRDILQKSRADIEKLTQEYEKVRYGR